MQGIQQIWLKRKKKEDDKMESICSMQCSRTEWTNGMKQYQVQREFHEVKCCHEGSAMMNHEMK